VPEAANVITAGGLAVLIGTQRRARGRGIAVRLAAPGQQTAELLRNSGLDRSFTICATVADAVPQRWRWGRDVIPQLAAETA
jgi:anti-anti-sigma regulatory factor